MNESKATRYQRGKRRAQTAGVLSGGLMLALLALTPAGSGLARWAGGVTSGGPVILRLPLALTLFTLVVALLWEVAWLPAMWFLGATAGPRQGRQGATWGEALAAQGQAALIAAAAAFVVGGTVHLAAHVAGGWWWLLSGAVMASVLVGAMHGLPGVLARASGARPIERPELVERLGALALRVRVPIASIDELPESSPVTATALVAGGGESRRVFIAAELMRDWSDEEIAVVVAHELAHHAHYDLWRTLALDVGILCGGLWLADVVLRAGGAWRSAMDLAALPLIALVTSLVWIATAPIRHALSRRQERQADAFALRLTGGVSAFQAAIRRLAARHLAEERPSRLTRWLFHRHPSAAERLQGADAFQRRD